MDVILGHGLPNYPGSPPTTPSPLAVSKDIIWAEFVDFGTTHSYDVSPDSSAEELTVPAENVERGSPWLGYTITISGVYGEERVQN